MNGFLAAVAERVSRVFACSLIATLGSGATGVTSMPWTSALNISAGVAVLETLACLAAGQVAPRGPGLTETVSAKEEP